jgi:hypothetical protein
MKQINEYLEVGYCQCGQPLMAEHLSKWAYNQLSAAPDLLEEHKQWAKILGHIFVMGLQKDYEALEIYAKNIKIEFVDGEPSLKSEAIAKAEGKE